VAPPVEIWFNRITQRAIRRGTFRNVKELVTKIDQFVANDTQAGHHVKTIESLELTIKANPKVIQRFKTFNNKRNKSVYDVAGAVSDQELEAMVKLAEELRNNTLAWLRNLRRWPRDSGDGCSVGKNSPEYGVVRARRRWQTLLDKC
jgi:hypothetical protein